MLKKIVGVLSVCLALLTGCASAQSVRDSVVCTKCVPVVDTTSVPYQDSIKVIFKQLPILDSVRVVAKIDTIWKDSTFVVRVDTTWRDSVFTTCCKTVVDTTWKDSTVSVPLPPPSAMYPNQPVGMVKITENDASTKPLTKCPTCSWWFYNGRLQVVQTDRGPAWETNYPLTQKGGEGSVNMGARAWPSQSELYSSFWIRIGENRGAGAVPGNTFDTNPSGTKWLGFWGSGSRADAAAEVIIMLLNTARPASVFKLEIRQQNVLQPNGWVVRNMGQNRDRGYLVAAGVWNHIETYWKLNTVGQSDGIARVWVNGVLVIEYTNVVWRAAPKIDGFYAWKWNPTWGGGAATKLQDDVMQMDHVYISGKPCVNSTC